MDYDKKREEFKKNIDKFDYEEHRRLWEEHKASGKDIKEWDKYEWEKYGGNVTFCQFCGIAVGAVWYIACGTQCNDCYEFWKDKKKLDSQVLYNRAKTRKAKECWQYYINEKNNKS